MQVRAATMPCPEDGQTKQLRLQCERRSPGPTTQSAESLIILLLVEDAPGHPRIKFAATGLPQKPLTNVRVRG